MKTMRRSRRPRAPSEAAEDQGQEGCPQSHSVAVAAPALPQPRPTAHHPRPPSVCPSYLQHSVLSSLHRSFPFLCFVCLCFVSSGSEVSCVFFFNLFVFIFGGILNKFIAVRYPSLVLEISFYSGDWARGLRRDRWNLGQGRSPLSPRLVAGTGLCLEPAGVSRHSPKGLLEVTVGKWAMFG